MEATTYFSDTFETNDLSLWSGSNGSPATESTIKYFGSYGLGVVASQYLASKVYKTLASTYASGYFQFRVYFNSSFTDGDYIVFGFLASDAGSAIARLVATRTGANYNLSIENIANSVTYSYAWSSFAVQTWYTLELYLNINNTSGSFTLYLNGSSIITQSSIDTDISAGTNIGELDVGIHSNTYAASNINLYYDNVFFSDSYIGLGFFPYIQQTSDIDSVADVGTHSNFTAQQYAPDLINDTLTEADVDTTTTAFGRSTTTGTSYRTIAASQTRGQQFTANLTGELTGLTFYGRGDTVTVNAKALITDTSGNLLTNGVSSSVSCTTTAGDKTASWSAGSRPLVTSGTDYIIWVISDGNLRLYYSATTGGTSKSDTTNSYTTPTSPTDASSTTDNYRRLYVSVAGLNYSLALEEQFTNIPSGYNNSVLSIYAGTWTTSETLNVQGWCVGNSSWTTIGSLTKNQWNNISVNSWVNSVNSTFYIRFVDGTTSNDNVQDSWSIDSVYLIRNYSVTYSSYSFTLAVTISVGNALVTQKALSKTLTQTVTVNNALALKRVISKTLTATIAVGSSLVMNKGVLQKLTATIAVTSALVTRKTLTDLLSASVSVLNSLDTRKTLSKVLTAVASVSSSLVGTRGLRFVLAQTISVVGSVVSRWSLTKSLTASVSIVSSLSSLKSLTNSFSVSVAVGSALVSSKALLQQISEVLTGLVNVGNTLSVQKGVTKILTQTVTVNNLLASTKGIFKVLTDLVQVNNALGAQKAFTRVFSQVVSVANSLISQKDLTQVFAQTVTVTIVLDSSKALAKAIVETLTGLVNVNSSLNVQKGVTKVLSQIVTVSSNLFSLKGLRFLLLAPVTLVAGLTANLGVNHVFSEVLTGLVTPNANLFVSKGMHELLTVLVSVGGGFVSNIHLGLHFTVAVLSGTVNVGDVAEFSQALHVAFFEFVGRINVIDSLRYPFIPELSGDEWLVIGGVLAAVVVGCVALALFMVRKNDDD